MPVKGGSRYGCPIHLFKKPIDGVRTAKGLFFFKLNGFFNDLTGNAAGFAAIRSAFPCQCVKSPLPVTVELAAQSGKGRFADSPVRKTDRFSGQLFEKPVGQLRFDLFINDRS